METDCNVHAGETKNMHEQYVLLAGKQLPSLHLFVYSKRGLKKEEIRMSASFVPHSLLCAL